VSARAGADAPDSGHHAGEARRRPSPDDLRAARGRTVRDVIAPDLDVLFVGINPSLYSGAVGHHFSRPGNRFWPTLHGAGFTDRQLSPYEERELLRFGVGITNLVAAATARADEVPADDLVAGAARLARKARRWRPRFVAVLGITAYRPAFGRPSAAFGEQPQPIARARLWVLPNPSGLNASYQVPDLIRAFGGLRAAIG
jgi:double-stranded uracil-DNA glycosylase